MTIPQGAYSLQNPLLEETPENSIFRHCTFLAVFQLQAAPQNGPLLFWLWSHPAAAAKSLQLCPTLCDPRDGSPPGSAVPGILQARTLEWVAISFSRSHPRGQKQTGPVNLMVSNLLTISWQQNEFLSSRGRKLAPGSAYCGNLEPPLEGSIGKCVHCSFQLESVPQVCPQT